MYSAQDTSCEVGFPIRKSAGQRLFAPHRSISQRTTSFIASQRQGIHRMPLRHLITLIIDARQSLSGPADIDNSYIERPVSLLRDLPDRRRLSLRIRVSTCLRPLAEPTASDKPSLHDVSDRRGPMRDRANFVSYGRSLDIGRSQARLKQRLATPSRHQLNGGARRDRTDDLLLAKQALSQLSYGPAGSE
jgi:hypothetical protein